MSETINLYFRVDSARPDQRPYRQTEFDMRPAGVTESILVKIPVSKENVVKEEEGVVIVTIDALKELADLFDLTFVNKTGFEGNEKSPWEDEPSDLDGFE